MNLKLEAMPIVEDEQMVKLYAFVLHDSDGDVWSSDGSLHLFKRDAIDEAVQIITDVDNDLNYDEDRLGEIPGEKLAREELTKNDFIEVLGNKFYISEFEVPARLVRKSFLYKFLVTMDNKTKEIEICKYGFDDITDLKYSLSHQLLVVDKKAAQKFEIAESRLANKINDISDNVFNKFGKHINAKIIQKSLSDDVEEIVWSIVEHA